MKKLPLGIVEVKTVVFKISNGTVFASLSEAIKYEVENLLQSYLEKQDVFILNDSAAEVAEFLVENWDEIKTLLSHLESVNE